MQQSKTMIKNLKLACEQLVGVIEAAGIYNLSRGVELGQTVWSVKCHDALEFAKSALSSVVEDPLIDDPSLVCRHGDYHVRIVLKGDPVAIGETWMFKEAGIETYFIDEDYCPDTHGLGAFTDRFFLKDVIRADGKGLLLDDAKKTYMKPDALVFALSSNARYQEYLAKMA